MADAMKLLPCPMCGGEAALLDYEARYGGLHYASRCPQCASCGCSMGYLPTAKKAVEAWNCRASMPPEKTPSFDDARRKLIHCIEQWDGETEYDAEDIAALADDILDVFASPPAREEAPAEGAVWSAIRELFATHAERYAKATQHQEASAIADNAARDIEAALRNRTSEPEAGGDGWEAATQAAWDANNPEPETLGPSAGFWSNVITRPAPATADKLRAVVEGFVFDLTGGHPNARRTRLVISHDALSARIEQALAALNEQPQ